MIFARAAHRSIENIRLRISLTLIAVLTFASTAGAVVLAPEKPSDLRTLSNTGAMCPGTSSSQAVDEQQNPDGTIAPFSIPAGSVLVVTSYSFATSTSPGSTANVGLLATNGTTVSALAQCFAVGDADGHAGASCTTPAGIAVNGGSTLCVSRPARVFVHGFIADDK